jgi:hypothetical protein
MHASIDVKLRARDAVRVDDGFFLPRLASCFLVQEHSDAERLASAYPECHFLLPDGTSYHGAAVSGGRPHHR